MRRTNRQRYLMDPAGPDSRHFAPPTAPAHEAEQHPASGSAGAHGEPDSPNWWGAWIDLGGEG
jgi:hypothetical protein